MTLSGARKSSSSNLLTLACIFSSLIVPPWALYETSREKAVDVREVVDGGTKYTNRLLTVRGCYVHEFEISVLKPCERRTDEFNNYVLWVDDIDEVTQTAGTKKHVSFIPAGSAELQKQGRDDMWKLEATRQHPLSVVLVGEFQTDKSQKYGHLNAYRNRFIVHELVWHETQRKALDPTTKTAK